MRHHKYKFPITSLILSFIALAQSHGAVLLGSDFTGRTVSGTTANNISFTTNGISTAQTSLTATQTTGTPILTTLFDGPAAAGAFVPDLNTGNEGLFEALITFTVLGQPVVIEDLQLVTFNLNNNGTAQLGGGSPDDFNIQLEDSLGGVIFSQAISQVGGPTTGASVAVDIPDVTLSAGSTFTLALSTVAAAGGNNLGFTEFAINGSIIPEPSSIILIGFSLPILLFHRRRRKL